MDWVHDSVQELDKAAAFLSYTTSAAAIQFCTLYFNRIYSNVFKNDRIHLGQFRNNSDSGRNIGSHVFIIKVGLKSWPRDRIS